MRTRRTAGLFRSPQARFLPAALLALSCTDQEPVSITAPVEERPAFASADSKIALELHNHARLSRTISGQQFVEISLRARCPTGYNQLEEPLTLTQGSAFGQGGFGLICTGRWERRTFRVFSMGDVEFHRGSARASVALQVEHETTGALLTATDTEFLKLR